MTRIEYGVRHEDGEIEVISELNLLDSRPVDVRAAWIALCWQGEVITRTWTASEWTVPTPTEESHA